MTVTTGRREANKRATRQALQQAADRLFAEQGYAQTTVRDIAEAAGVTERTFFLYFGGKEELIIDDALDWLPLLKDHVRAARRRKTRSPRCATRSGPWARTCASHPGPHPCGCSMTALPECASTASARAPSCAPSQAWPT